MTQSSPLCFFDTTSIYHGRPIKLQSFSFFHLGLPGHQIKHHFVPKEIGGKSRSPSPTPPTPTPIAEFGSDHPLQRTATSIMLYPKSRDGWTGVAGGDLRKAELGWRAGLMGWPMGGVFGEEGLWVCTDGCRTATWGQAAA